MNVLAFDTETALIRPGLHAPPLTCITFQRPGLEPRIEHVYGALPRLRSWLTDTTTVLVGHFVSYDLAVCCAEFPELMPLVFKAFREQRITCTKIRQQLLDIAGGVFRGGPTPEGKWRVNNYDLADLTRRHTGRVLQKDAWRLEYANFRDVPLARWTERASELQTRARARRAELPAIVDKDAPEADEVKRLDAMIADAPEGALQYPLEDARATLDVYLAQEKHAEYLADQYRQTFAQFALYLSSTWGARTSSEGVAALKEELSEAHGELETELQALGLVRADGTRDMKAIKVRMIAACAAYGVSIRWTDAHTKDSDGNPRTCPAGDLCDKHISLDGDACEAIVQASASGDGPDVEDDAAEAFVAYAEFSAITKMLNNDVAMLERGVEYPVHTRHDMAETGRGTSSKPALQNINTGRMKKGQEGRVSMRLRPGVRQAFVPRPGRVFIQADFPQLELYTLAQCCYSWLGYSKLGDMLNAGLDPHLNFAAMLLGIDYDEAKRRKKESQVDQARQIGKVFNFGKPGGMGNKKLKTWAWKTYGVDLSLEQLEKYTLLWKQTLPEMPAYFARVAAMFGQDASRVSVETLFTQRRRGGATYCAACNNGFQALGSDCAKAAACLIAEAEYAIPTSPLFGSRTVFFVHDEFIAETDDGPGVHDAAHELARLMTLGANQYLPNVPIPLAKMEPLAMRMWSKGAEPVFQSGRLAVWEPKKTAVAA